MRYVYMLGCADDTIYTGITTDIDRRVSEHNSSEQGASYTRGRRPVRLLRSTVAESRSQATKLELQIKKLTRAEKLSMIG